MNILVSLILLLTTVAPERSVPDNQASNLSVVPKQLSAKLHCIPGTGGGRILIGKMGAPVDAEPVNGVAYSGSLQFGEGDEIGENNFVLSVGDQTSFVVTGLKGSTPYYFNVYEFNPNGYAYLTTLTTNSATAQTMAYYADEFINDQNFSNFYSSGSGSNGQLVIQNRGRLFYDFTRLSGNDNTLIANGDPGLVDYGPRKLASATIVNAPKVKQLTVGTNAVKALNSYELNAVSANNNGSGLFTSSFEINTMVYLEDGIASDVAVPWYTLCGIEAKGNTFQVIVLQNGQIDIRYQSGSATLVDVVTTPSPILNGVNNLFRLRVRVDFEKDSISVWRDNFKIPMQGGNVAVINPSTWANANSFYVGSRDNGISPFNNVRESAISKFVITDLLTPQESRDLDDYLRSVGFTSGDYNVGGSNGFTRLDVTGGDLAAEGDPAGWQSYVEHKKILTADMEDFEFETKVRITAAPDGTSYGFSIGMRNDLSSESNRAVLGYFSTEADNPGNFGRLFIYYGDGSVNSNAMAFGSASNPISPLPSANTEYKVIFKRTVQSPNAVYTVTVTDSLRNNSISASWTEVNKPSSGFFGTSMRTFFHQNGGSHLIKYWVVRKPTGVTPPDPIPPTGNYDVYVAAGGNDANNGSSSAPKLTIEAGFNAIRAMGGSNRKMGIGAGTYVLSSHQDIPANCSLVEGAGKGVTIITGHPAIYRRFLDIEMWNTRNFDINAFLFKMNSGSATTGNHAIKNLTLDGSNRQIVGGISVKYQSGITLENVGFQDFNFAGVWLQFTSNGLVKNCEWTSCGGDPGVTSCSGASYTTGAVTFNFVTDYEFSGGTINNATFRTGYGFKMLDQNFNYKNILIHDMSITTNQDACYNGGNYTCIGIEMNSGTFSNVQIYNNRIAGGNALSIIEIGTAPDNKFLIHDNELIVSGSVYGGIELFAQKAEVYNNYLHGNVRNFIFAVGVHPPNYFADWNIHHNVAEVNPTNGQSKHILAIGGMRLQNCRIHHNTFVAMSTMTSDYYALLSNDQSQGSASTITCENNAFHGKFSSLGGNIWFATGSGINVQSRNNKSTDANVNQSFSGVTNSNNTVYGSGNTLKLKLSGNKPKPYYEPNTGSPLIGGGTDGGNVGAY